MPRNDAFCVRKNWNLLWQKFFEKLVTCQSNFQFVKVNSMQKVKTSLEGAFIAFLGCFFDQKHVKYIIS